MYGLMKKIKINWLKCLYWCKLIKDPIEVLRKKNWIKVVSWKKSGIILESIWSWYCF